MILCRHTKIETPVISSPLNEVCNRIINGKKGWGIFGWPGFLIFYALRSFCLTIWSIECPDIFLAWILYITHWNSVHDCHIAVIPPPGRRATLCDGSSWAKRAFGWWPRRHDEVRLLCKKKKTVVVLLDNMKNSSSSTVITVSKNCPRAPDDCSMKAGVEPEIPRCSCLPHIRTVQKLIKVNEYRRWGLGNFVLKKPSDQNM